jgi:hypothetical protein
MSTRICPLEAYVDATRQHSSHGKAVGEKEGYWAVKEIFGKAIRFATLDVFSPS